MIPALLDRWLYDYYNTFVSLTEDVIMRYARAFVSSKMMNDVIHARNLSSTALGRP